MAFRSVIALRYRSASLEVALTVGLIALWLETMKISIKTECQPTTKRHQADYDRLVYRFETSLPEWRIDEGRNDARTSVSEVGHLVSISAATRRPPTKTLTGRDKWPAPIEDHLPCKSQDQPPTTRTRQVALSIRLNNIDYMGGTNETSRLIFSCYLAIYFLICFRYIS